MYPFVSNQISKIRSAWIIKHYFRIVDHLQYQMLEVAWFSENFFENSFWVSDSIFPTSPSFPSSHSKVYSYCFSPKKIVHAKYVKNGFFSALLFTLHSVRLYFCLSVFVCFLFPVSHSFLPSAAVMARNESTIWLAVFLKGLWGENSIFVVNSKKTTKDLCERSLQKSADNHFLHQSRILTSLLVFGDWWFVNIVQLRWNE